MARKRKTDSPPAADESTGGLGGETSGWRSRIVDRGRVDPRDLNPHPLNHRSHPVSQRDALRAAIREVGFVRSVTVNRTTGHVLDGHLRLEIALEDREPLIDVEYVELSEGEERLVLATMDQITAGAEIDAAKLDALLREVEASEPDLQEMLSSMAEAAGVIPPDEDEVVRLTKLELPPPSMAWCLIAIPTTRYGEIAADIERIASVPDVICETALNNG